MVVIVSIETVLLVLVVILVAGLLRSHAELLRRLGGGEEPLRPPADQVIPEPSSASARGEDLAAPPLSGTTPDGDAVRLSFQGASARPTLLAFLTSGCSTCLGFWETLGPARLPHVEVVAVTHGPERERPGRLRALAGEDVTVVMSDQAWADYRVPGAPYFVLIDDRIRGEGAAGSWEALSSLVREASEDEHADHGPARAREVDRALAAAGIVPGDPSLYPGSRPQP